MEPSKPIASSSWFWPAAVLVALVLGSGVLRGAAAAESDAPQGEPPRVSAVCLDCHDGYDAGLALGPHRIDPETPDGPGASLACTDCHAGPAAHFEDDPEANPMPRPSDLGVAGMGTLCATCHLTDHQQNMMERNVHAQSQIDCSDCHRVHGGTGAGLLRTAETELCLDCHKSQRGSFDQPYRHPVDDGIVRCSECHLTLDKVWIDLSMNGTNGVCGDCHREFTGPYPFEHQATLDYSTEEGGCLSCHEAHGSAHPRLLKQPYEAPHFQLCTQCHSVPPGHNNNFKHGTQWAGMSCNECHADIHGSYTSRSLLSESLEAEGCFTSGCHPPGR